MGRHRKVKLGDWRQPWLRVAGAILLVVSAGIHLDLYLTGYRSIPTIGWLFLVQFLVAFVLAIGALVTHSRLVAVAGAASRCPPWAPICWRSGSGCSDTRRSERGRGSPLA